MHLLNGRVFLYRSTRFLRLFTSDFNICMQVEVDVVSVEKPAYLNDVEQNRDDAAADVKATATRPPV